MHATLHCRHLFVNTLPTNPGPHPSHEQKWLQQNVSAESRLRLSSLGIEIPEEEEDTLRARHSPPRPTAPSAAHPGLPPA